MKSLIIGLIALFVGIFITWGTYSAASEEGGTYVVTWGLILYGAVKTLRSLYALLFPEKFE